jgi:glycosyltransferase involved in cell wall biosynthesis
MRGVGTETIEDVVVHRLPIRWEFQGRVWMTGLTRKIATLKPDAVFVHGTGCPASFKIASWCRRNGVTLVMDNHMTFSSIREGMASRLYYILLRYLTRSFLVPATHRFLGVAQECCDFLHSKQHIPLDRIDLLPLGIDTDLLAPQSDARNKFLDAVGLPSDAIVIMQTGKITPDKGADLLTKAVAPLMADNPKLHLILVGAGPDDFRNDVLRPVKSHKVEDQFHVLPFVTTAELATYFSAADICVFAKAASLSCLEAAACGKPVLMTDMPIGKWRAEKGAGQTFRDGDADDLRSKISELLVSGERRDTLGNAARSSVQEHFSYDRVARQSEDIMAAAEAI